MREFFVHNPQFIAFNGPDVNTNHDLATNNDNKEQSVNGQNLINQRIKSDKENVKLRTVIKMSENIKEKLVNTPISWQISLQNSLS